MFGLEKRVLRVRAALVRDLKAKSAAIMLEHADKKPEDIPWLALARAMILGDVADILQNLVVKEHPDDNRA